MDRTLIAHRTARHMFSVVAIAALAMMTAGVATPAHATPPGQNGRIAYRSYFDQAQTRGAIFTIHPDGTGLVQVTHRGKTVLDTTPDWSPDGRWIVFMRQAGLVCSCKPSRVFKVRPNGTHLTRLSNHPCVPGNCVEDLYPAWSPDGKRIAFTRFDDDAGLVALYVMRADGTHEHQVPGTAEHDGQVAQWSPDGTHLVFDGGRLNGKRGEAIFTIRLGGRHARRLTPWPMHAGGASDWSPNGRWILVESHADQDRQNNLFLVHPNGADLHRITTSPGHVRQWGRYSFSPDGTMISVAHTVNGDQDVWVMKVDGSGLRDVTNSTLFDGAPDWGPLPT